MLRPQFDPSKLDDDVALKTSWGPVKGGGTNFCTHSLKEISPGRVAFKIRGMAILFPSIFMLIGIAVLIGLSFAGLKQDIKLVYFAIPFGSVFFLVGFFILRSWMTPRVFDYNFGYYWKSRNEPTSPGDIQRTKEYCQLKDIHAIQLLQEYCKSSSSKGGNTSYYSYELNLVKEDGSRINIVDHGKRSVILEDAEKLSTFLNVPVWNATF